MPITSPMDLFIQPMMSPWLVACCLGVRLLSSASSAAFSFAATVPIASGWRLPELVKSRFVMMSILASSLARSYRNVSFCILIS